MTMRLSVVAAAALGCDVMDALLFLVEKKALFNNHTDFRNEYHAVVVNITLFNVSIRPQISRFYEESPLTECDSTLVCIAVCYVFSRAGPRPQPAIGPANYQLPRVQFMAPLRPFGCDSRCTVCSHSARVLSFFPSTSHCKKCSGKKGGGGAGSGWAY